MTTKSSIINLEIPTYHLENLPLPVVITAGTAFTIQYMNAKALAMFGCMMQDVVYKDLNTLLSSTRSQSFLQDVFAQTFIEKKIIETEEFVAIANGKTISMRLVNEPFVDEQGRCSYVLTSFIVEDHPKSSERRYPSDELYSLFKTAPVGVVYYRGDNFIIDFANDIVLKIWGKTLEEVIHQPLTQVFPELQTIPNSRDIYIFGLEKLKQGIGFTANEVEMSFIRHGEIYTGWYSFSHEPVKDESGNIIGVMAFVVDVSDQMRIRKEAQRQSTQMQLITDALPSLISYVNAQEQYEFVNHAYESWFGLERKDICGKTLYEVLGDEAYKKIQPRIQKALQGEHSSIEAWLTYKTGGTRFVSASYIPHVDEAGEVIGYFGLVNDLTERKRYEEALEQSEERLRLSTEATNAGTFEFDIEHQQLYWSERLKLICGFQSDDVITPAIAGSILHPDDVARVLEEVQQARNTRASGHLVSDHRIIRKNDQAVRWIHSRTKTYFRTDKNGNSSPVRTIGFVIDVTEQKQAEERYKLLSLSLEEKVKQRTEELSRLNQELSVRNAQLVHTQSFLQQLIDSSVEYIAVLDNDFRYITANKRFEKIISKTREELLGQHIFDVHPKARGSYQYECLLRAQQGETIHIKKHPAASIPDMYFDSYFIPLIIEGNIQGVIAMSRDVTAIVHSEMELENSNRQLQDAQQLAKLGSWEWDLMNNAFSWSDEMFRIFEYPKTSTVNVQLVADRMAPEHAEQMKTKLNEYVDEAIHLFKTNGTTMHTIPSSEIPIQLSDGSQKIIRSTGNVYLSTEGNVIKIVGTVQDITALRATEEKLRMAVRELARKNLVLEMTNKELESFNYIASHDLQEPLRKIRTFIDRIHNLNPERESIETYISKIDSSSRRMSDLIHSMLTFSRLENIPQQYTDVDLNEIWEQVVGELEISIKEKNAHIKADHLPIVKAHAHQMFQLLCNLLSNALKFCDRTPVIHLRYRQVNRKDSSDNHLIYHEISIEDNGIGFEMEYKDNIFKIFQRLHSQHVYSGTGIGLAIVKKIIEGHHGTIDVWSEPGKGTVFTLTLPIVQHP